MQRVDLSKRAEYDRVMRSVLAKLATVVTWPRLPLMASKAERVAFPCSAPGELAIRGVRL
jgi:hypothetical protein